MVAADSQQSSHRVRRWLALACVVIGVVFAIAFLVSRLAHAYAFDTDRVVATLGPAIQEPEVSHAISTRVVTDVMAKTELEAKLTDELDNRLPRVAPVLVPEVMDRLEQRLIMRTEEALQSDAVRGWWEGAIRATHGKFVELARETNPEDVENVAMRANQVAGVTSKLLENYGDELGVEVPAGATSDFVLISEERVENAQRILEYLRWLDRAPGVLSALMALTFLIAIAISPRRLRTLAHIAFGCAIGALLLLVVFRIVPDELASLAPREEGRVALTVLLAQFAETPVERLRIALVLSLLLGVAFLWIERIARGGESREHAREQALGLWALAQRAGRWIATEVRTYPDVATWAGPVIASGYLLFGPDPSVGQTFWVIVLAVGWVVGMRAVLTASGSSTGTKPSA
jgi:hypothetical protein